VPEQSEFSDRKTIFFITVLSAACALVLAILASCLAQPKKEAKELDQTKEILVATQIYNKLTGTFQIEESPHRWQMAKYSKNGQLVASDVAVKATPEEILAVARARIKPFLVDSEGNSFSFQEKRINFDHYLLDNKKTGYADLPLKLAYEILPNPDGKAASKPVGYIIPINGMGLWDRIYGYMAIAPNGVDVIGISWYDQKETPGLGGNIAEPIWQKLFVGKKIFVLDPHAPGDLVRAPIGITIVKGKVKDVLGDSPRAVAAVDGMAGATLTGNGVTKAYHSSLDPYRPFFIRLHSQEGSSHGS